MTPDSLPGQGKIRRLPFINLLRWWWLLILFQVKEKLDERILQMDNDLTAAYGAKKRVEESKVRCI